VTGRSACVFYGRTGPAYNWPSASISMAEPARTDGWTDGQTNGSVRASVRLWPLDAEKSDGGRREKWREKDKTTVGWRAFEVVKPRSWEWNPVAVFRGPETQVLRVKPSVRLWRSWNPGPQSQIPRSWNPMSWEPKAATRACRHGRIVSDRHGYPLVVDKSISFS